MEPLVEPAATGRSQPGGPTLPVGTAARRGTPPPEGRVLPDGTAPSGDVQPPNFDERVAALCQDRDIRLFAIKYARDHQLAEDALQETYYAVARVRDPARIEDLRKYFCRALKNQIGRLTEQAGPPPTGDVDAVLGAKATGGRRPSARSSPCEERGVRTAQEATWLGLLRETSAVSVPERSGNPERYQGVVAAIARWVLQALLAGEVSATDVNGLLISQYPEWFAATGSSPDTYHQRLSRARRDVFDLLASVVGRDELLP